MGLMVGSMDVGEGGTHPTRFSFRGGVRRLPVGMGWGWPFGRLTIDEDRIAITGPGILAVATKKETAMVKLRGGIFSSRVIVTKRDGADLDVYFAANDRKVVRSALELLGWEVDG
jgi:hypothetical protein